MHQDHLAQLKNNENMSTDSGKCVKIVDQKICAVVVTYQPSMPLLRNLLEATMPQVSHIVIVDNGSEQDLADLRDDDRVKVLLLGDNNGIATGFNVGIRWAEAHGFSHVLLMDQDSIPSSNMVELLFRSMDNLSQSAINVAAVGPRCLDTDTGFTLPFARIGKLTFEFITSNEKGDIIPTDFLISSGSLISIETLRLVGTMDEPLFIDLVDAEWFLRAAHQGYKAFGVYPAIMYHRLGNRSIRLPSRRKKKIHYVSVHSPVRYYYIFRNSMILNRRPYVPHRWKVNNLIQLIYSLAFFTMVISQGSRNLRMMLRGLIDGVRGRMGRYRG